MGLRKPGKKDIKSGSIVDIFDREGIREGKAELIRRAPSKYIQDGRPYIRHDRGPDDDIERVIIEQEGAKKWCVYDEAMQCISECHDTKESAVSWAVKNDYEVVDAFVGSSYIWSYERWLVEWINHPRLRKGDRSTVEVNYFVKLAKAAPCMYDNEITPQETSIRLLFLELTGTIQLSGEVCCVTDLNKVWRSFKKPDCVIFTHNQLQAKELFELHGVKARIAGFIDPKEFSFEEGILSYLEEHSWEDFLVLTGDFDSKEFKHKEIKERTIRSNPNEGLKWLKRKK